MTRILQCATSSRTKAEQVRGASPAVGHTRWGTSRNDDSGSGAGAAGGGSRPSEVLQEAVWLKPMTADVVKSAVSAALIPTVAQMPAASLEFVHQKSQPVVEHEPVAVRAVTMTAAVRMAAVVSRAGATFEVVHGAGGFTSGCGPFVKRSEQPVVEKQYTKSIRATLERMSHLASQAARRTKLRSQAAGLGYGRSSPSSLGPPSESQTSVECG